MNRCGAVSVCLRVLILPLLILRIVVPATAETPGVTANSILIGSCSALEGPAQVLGNQTVMGATALISRFNDAGEVFGRKIQLLAFDDRSTVPIRPRPASSA